MDRELTARRVRIAVATAVVALVAALALPGAGGATPDGRAFPPVRPTRVLILGDSVMKGAVSAYPGALPGREVTVSAEVNRSTGQGADELARLGTDWDVVVILLGHNDGGSPGAFQPAARRILDQLRGVRVVSWLTIHEVRPYYPGVNQYIAGLRADYPNLIVGDWNAVAAANPGALAGDGLHLNGEGARLMAGVVADQVEIAELDWGLALQALARAATTTTTTTTLPPTTTTVATTSTTMAPTTTTTTEATTTGAPASSSTVAEPPGPRDPEDGSSDDRTPLALGALAAAAVALGGVGWRRRRRASAPQG
ncbi:MAG: hypothetical protein R2702_11950 [Acidimicrobiales bacterium]